LGVSPETSPDEPRRPPDRIFFSETLKYKINQTPSNTMKTKISLLVALLVALVSLPVFGQADKQKPFNEKATADAWEALANGKDEAAITNANLCIGEYRGQATRQQEKLHKEKADLPTGAVSEEVKKKILENGLLNDVGACYIIKGKAEEKLGKIDDAKKTYAEAKKLTYARVWDPQGQLFWSPAEAAGDRLDALKSH
jgi:hypothetical protein